MDCNVIMDLLPLYADGCCSKQSEELVKEHLKSCKVCKQAYADMSEENLGDSVNITPPVKIGRINQFKASVLQSVLLFLSFAAITLGVTFEATTPMGIDNGNWAYMLIVPATAFMLSLVNWYFVRFYKNRSVFSTCSAVITFGLALCGYVWAVLHYGSFTSYYFVFGIGLVVTAVLCAVSKIISSLYAKAIGKE